MLVSVIMPTHNRSRLLKRAIQSVLEQAFTDYQIIIVDDGSTDDTQKGVEQFNDSRIKYIKLDKNTGGSMIPRQIGHKYADTKYIAVLDDDDYWVDKSKLTMQVTYLETHPECVAVGTDAVITNEDNTKKVYYHYPNTFAEIRNRILSYNCFYHSSVMYRNETFESIGEYNVMGSGKYARFSNDYDLWLRMGLKGEIINLPIYGVGHIYTPIRLNVSEQFYYMVKQMKLIKKYRHDYPNYMLANILKVVIHLANLPMSVIVKNGWHNS